MKWLGIKLIEGLSLAHIQHGRFFLVIVEALLPILAQFRARLDPESPVKTTFSVPLFVANSNAKPTAEFRVITSSWYTSKTVSTVSALRRTRCSNPFSVGHNVATHCTHIAQIQQTCEFSLDSRAQIQTHGFPVRRILGAVHRLSKQHEEIFQFGSMVAVGVRDNHMVNTHRSPPARWNFSMKS